MKKVYLNILVEIYELMSEVINKIGFSKEWIEDVRSIDRKIMDERKVAEVW